MKIKHVFIVVLAIVMIAAVGCQAKGKAKIRATNKSDITLRLRVDYATSKIAPGQTEVFELSWPGKNVVWRADLFYYPDTSGAYMDVVNLDLKNGDDVQVDLYWPPKQSTAN